MKQRTVIAIFMTALVLALGAVAAVAPAQQSATKKPSASKSSKTSAAKTQNQPAASKKPVPDVVTLKAPNGDVKFSHTAHAKDRSIKCETCHHPSKPQKPLKAAQQRCSDCHTRTPAAPMKTKLQAAFHNPTATAGTCIDCHKSENAKGKKAPTKCQECHKKATA